MKKHILKALYVVPALALVSILAATFSTPTQALSSGVVISQVYGGGGNSGAPYRNDYVELFNLSSSPVSLSGWSIQYASATGTGNFGNNPIVPLSGTLAPGQYYLVQLASGGTSGALLPTPDASGTINMSATGGKVALVNTTAGLACNGGSTPCTPAQLAQIIDLVGWDGANFYETAPAPSTSNTTALFRKGNGCTETDNNSLDFVAGAPSPRNTASPFNPCAADEAPRVINTYPINGASDVPVNADLSVTFSEPVNVSGAWYALTCSISGSLSGLVSGGPTTFTINPASDFASGESCSLTIFAANVTDQDLNDPPDNMAADFSIGFSAVDVCTLSYTPIYAIQGDGPIAAITGTVTTQGVVIGDYEGPSPALRGFYIQDLNGDGDSATSDGIFVFNGNNNSVSLGEVVRVSGSAGEFQGQTQISASSIVHCGTGSVQPTNVYLPFPSTDYPERYEGMLVRLPQTLYVTEHFQLGRFGQIVMSSGGRLQQPTNVTTPGAPALALQAANNLNRIIIDDALNNQNPDPILFARGGLPLSASNTLRGGDTASNIIGVMTYTWGGNAASPNAYRVRPINALNGGLPDFQPTNPRPAAAPEVGGSLRVAGMNLLNFFNTFDGLPDTVDNCTLGVGGAPTDCRGADTAAEFARQWPKTMAAILATQADVIGAVEIENDGYGPDSAIQFLVDRLNEATAPGTFAFIDADARTGQLNALGTDAIKVGLIYKPAKVTPIGQTAALNTETFVNGGDSAPRNRPALAQAFQQNSNGARFTVVVNHLKSKGSACDAPDAGDGQGNCNLVRLNAVGELINWLAGDPTGTSDPDFLLIGDFNSYAKEDPITFLENAGYTNLIATFVGPEAYSYVFDGQWGYLDHALGSTSLVPQVTGVADYHINADEPNVLDYNTDFKTLNLQTILYAPDEFRVSDHDPVLIGLQLRNDPPVANAGGPYFVDEGQTVALNGLGYDPDHSSITFDWDLDNDGFFETPGQTAVYHAIDGPATITVKLRVTDETGLSSTAPATIYVSNVSPSLGALSGPSAPVAVNTPIAISAPFSDPGVIDTHSASIDWGDGNQTVASIVETGGVGDLNGNHAYLAAGLYTVVVTLSDKDGAAAQQTFWPVVVYDPSSGFVTGGGWFDSPPGAYPADPSLGGKVNFGLVIKYLKNSTIPQGNLELQFKEASLNLKATSFDWLVVTTATAQFKGRATLNGEGDYSFMVWVSDGNPDTFRIKIWYQDAGGEHVFYDNGFNQPLGGGTISIKK